MASVALRPFHGSAAACAVRPWNSTYELDVCLEALEFGLRLVAGMPGEHDVGVAEEPFADHVDLAADLLFRRCAVETHGAFQLAARDELLHGDGGGEARRAEEIVTAALSCRAVLEGLLGGRHLLRDAGQGVVFAHDADDGAPRAVGGHERGRHAGDATLDREARAARRSRRAGRPTASRAGRSRQRPDLVAHADHLRALLLDERDSRRLRRRGALRPGDRRPRQQDANQPRTRVRIRIRSPPEKRPRLYATFRRATRSGRGDFRSP